jgi:hypothetical protein
MERVRSELPHLDKLLRKTFIRSFCREDFFCRLLLLCFSLRYRSALPSAKFLTPIQQVKQSLPVRIRSNSDGRHARGLLYLFEAICQHPLPGAVSGEGVHQRHRRHSLQQARCLLE